MAVTPQQRAQCVVWYAKFSIVTRTQLAFRRQYNCHHVPSHREIVKWYMLLENGLTMPHTGGRVRDRNREDSIRQAVIQCPRKSLRRLSAEKIVPYARCQRIVRLYLNIFPYHIIKWILFCNVFVSFCDISNGSPCISKKAFIVHVYGLHHYKGKLSIFFSEYITFSVNFSVGCRRYSTSFHVA
jgi:hypothetical protein